MANPVPASLHRSLYRAAYRVRAVLRRRFRLPVRGVSAILRDGGGRLLLVRHSYGAPGWTLPGGGCGRAEDPAETVRREIREELGIGIADVELLATLRETLSGAPHTAYVFAGVVRGEPEPDGREIVEARFFAREDLPRGLGWPTARRLAIWFEHVR